MSEGQCPTCGGTLSGEHGRCRACRADRTADPGPEPLGRVPAALVGVAVFLLLKSVGWILLLPPIFLLGIMVDSGALIGFLALGAVLFGLLASGGAAGYLRGSDRRQSALTGALSGLFLGAPFGILLVARPALQGSGVGAESSGVFVQLFGVVLMLVIALVLVTVLGLVCGAGGAMGATVSKRRAPED